MFEAVTGEEPESRPPFAWAVVALVAANCLLWLVQLKEGESFTAAESRWLADTQLVINARRIPWFVCQAYNAYTTTLETLMLRYPEMARSANVPTVIGWFAWLRPGGGLAHNLGPYALATQNATTPLTVPEGEMSAKATITSFESPIRVGETSRAVAKLTQGDPKKAWYQWQFQDGSWKNANTKRNPATDNDHHYALPHAGNFPIRLQTWDAPTGGKMTDQTGQSRVIVVQEDTSPEPEPIPPQGLIPFAKADGRIFRAPDGSALRYKGVTAFKLCRLFTDGGGAAIDGFLAAYNGFNVLRVWDYVTWKDTGWESCTAAQWKAFLAYVALKGFNVELTLLTNDDSARIEPAKNLVRELAQAPRPTNLLIEIGNEPETHKHIDTKALQGTCETSGFLYASGNYESCGDKDHPCSKAFGKYGCAHTPRDDQWSRKSHDLMEYYNGKGPHYITEPARPYPWVADEPAKMQDVQPPAGTAHWTWADDWRAYFGAASLLGAGATFHSESGKYGQVPTAAERPLIAAALEGLNAFPADAPNGPYSRPSDKSLRTYIVGANMVRVRPENGTPPQSGWSRVGPSDVLWRR